MPSCIQKNTGDFGGVGRPEAVPKVGSQGCIDVKIGRHAAHHKVRHSCGSRNPGEVTISAATSYGWLDGNDKVAFFPSFALVGQPRIA